MPRPQLKDSECRRARLSLGLTQDAFAALLGVAAITVRKIEGHTAKPGEELETKIRIAGAKIKLRKYEVAVAVEKLRRKLLRFVDTLPAG